MLHTQYFTLNWTKPPAKKQESWSTPNCLLAIKLLYSTLSKVCNNPQLFSDEIFIESLRDKDKCHQFSSWRICSNPFHPAGNYGIFHHTMGIIPIIGTQFVYEIKMFPFLTFCSKAVTHPFLKFILFTNWRTQIFEKIYFSYLLTFANQY